MKTPNMNQLTDAFAGAQETFNGLLDTTDFSTISNSRITLPSTELTHTNDFVALPSAQLTTYLGSILLLMNRELQALSPAIIMPSSDSAYNITMLNQTYDPKVGFTAGQHFGLSAKAQTSGSGFGGHGGRGGFEAGHFSTVLIGARSTDIGGALERRGDQATHAVIHSGVPELMSQHDLISVPYKTAIIPSSKLPLVQAFWHRGLETEHGMAQADYPNAVQLLMGSAIHELGASGIDTARQLVDKAIRRA